MEDSEKALRGQLRQFLEKGEAHATLHDALKGFPPQLTGKKPEGMAHTAWELLEHIRFTLHDLLEFCTNPNYEAPEWPKDYWPEEDAPEPESKWNTSMQKLDQYLSAFDQLLADPKTDLFARIPWGDGQTILREILLAIDHTSYHTGQLILLRQQLGVWK